MEAARSTVEPEQQSLGLGRPARRGLLARPLLDAPQRPLDRPFHLAHQAVALRLHAPLHAQILQSRRSHGLAPLAPTRPTTDDSRASRARLQTVPCLVSPQRLAC